MQNLPYRAEFRQEEYERSIWTGRQERLKKLKAPLSWLSLVAFHWLQPGEYRLGSSGDNDIPIPSGPAHLGVLSLSEIGELFFTRAPMVDASLHGRSFDTAPIFTDAISGQLQSVIEIGSLRLTVIERDGRKALRVRDASAALISKFAGLEYFDIDPAWRVIAKWERVAPGERRLELRRRLGTVSTVDAIGEATFSIDGQACSLSAYREHPGSNPFFVFSDLTCADHSHPTGRFVYADDPEDNEITIDFNLAHNPPSAFTPFANCPSAPVENHMPLRVAAGEKRYRGKVFELG
jgi:uncharacterized protein